MPHEVLHRPVADESKLKVWSEYRGSTQIDLSKQADVSQPSIAQLETGRRTGTLAMLKTLAKVLHLGIDDLI
ncbi:MAG: helix-turn-helix transcriptional regulator [Methylobacter sp.]|nr:helix-turn-helix transcriptional regulator [Methylobacter sp.]